MTPLRALIVDDDDGNRRLAVRMLVRRPGLEVSDACDGNACLTLASRSVFDVVLLDISMPGAGGVSVCQALRALPGYDRTRIIACTAHAGREELAHYLTVGFSSTLTKPFTLDELYRALGLAEIPCSP